MWSTVRKLVQTRFVATVNSTQTLGSRRQARLSLELLEHRDVPAVILVTNGNDSGAGSLRQAIIDSNQVVPEGDTIRIDPSVTQIDLESELPIIYGNLVIQGSTSSSGTHSSAGGFSGNPGHTLLNTDSDPYVFRFFTMVANGDSVTLQWLEMDAGGALGSAGGGISGDGNGGAIRSMTHLALEDCTFDNNIAQGMGGAVFQTMAPLSVTRCQFYTNISGGHDGGAICFIGGGGQSLTVTDSFFQYNHTYLPYANPYLYSTTDNGNGGAIFYSDYHGIVSISNTSFFNNTAASGGAVYLAEVQNVYIGGDERAVFAYNVSSTGRGGALYAYIELTGSIDADFYGNLSPEHESDAFLIVLSPTATVSVNFFRVADTYEIV